LHDFQQHFQNNQRAFSVSCPETNLQKRTAGESFFSRKSSNQFYFIISQPRIQQHAGRDSADAARDHDVDGGDLLLVHGAAGAGGWQSS
jgi:hypothetical protein